MIYQINGKVTNLIEKVVTVPKKLINVIAKKDLVDINKIELCSNMNCDRGFFITDRVTEDGRFELDKCEICNGLGFKEK